MIRFALPIFLLAAACAPVRPETGTPTPSTACGAEKVGKFVGEKRTDAISAQVARISGAKNIRWIKPGMAVTMDYREDRLNVRIDDKGVILSVNCG